MKTENNDIQALILTAGKVPEEMECVFSDIPNGLIPINGRPAIFLILDKLIEEGFKNILIGVGFKGEKIKKLIKKNYAGKIVNIGFVEADFRKRPGDTIIEALSKINADKLLIILGDTLITDNLISLVRNGSFVMTSKDFSDTKKWCVITKRGGFVDKIYHKLILKRENNLEALIGVYYFDKVDILKKIAERLKGETVEISAILDFYKKHRKIKVISTNGWYDVGHIDKYYEAKKVFLKSRFFNNLKVDPVLNTVVKMADSRGREKFTKEISWYCSVPINLKSFCPAIIEINHTVPYVKMEYIGYPTLAELWLYGNLSAEIWKNIINRLFKIIEIIKSNQSEIHLTDYEEIYINKTEERIQKLVAIQPIFQDLLKDKTIMINGEKYKNFPLIKEEVYKKCRRLFDKSDNCIIHGDLCFSNIFYSYEYGIFKFIDPRGNWAKESMAGDIKYDIAKLRHSIAGLYDFVVNGLYNIKQEKNKIDLNIFSEPIHEEVGRYFDEKIKNHWNLRDIKLIEGLLFISMLPLHNDDLNRQLALFSIGIRRLNEVL